MPNLILPSRFTRQPQYPAPIDRSNPLTRGLQYVQTGPNFAGFTNNNGVTVSPLSLGRWGAATSATYSAASSQYLSNPAPVVTGFPLTFAAAFRTGGVTGGKGLIGIGASTNNYHALYISGSSVVMVSFNGGTSSGTAAASAVVTANTPYIAVGRVASSTSRDVWIDGALIGTNTNTVTPAAANTLVIGATWTSGAPGTYMLGDIPLAAIWSRALSDAEIVEFSRNPWQIFQAPARRLYVPDSGVAPTFNAGWARGANTIIGGGVYA